MIQGGLVRRWGEIFPRWIPFLPGKRVPLAMANVPASVISVLVTAAGQMFVRLTFLGACRLGEHSLNLDENWAALTPELLWPVGRARSGCYARSFPPSPTWQVRVLRPQLAR